MLGGSRGSTPFIGKFLLVLWAGPESLTNCLRATHRFSSMPQLPDRQSGTCVSRVKLTVGNLAGDKVLTLKTTIPWQRFLATDKT